jgi:acyl dehydratase
MVGYMSTASTLSLNHVLHEPGLTDVPVSQGYDRVRFIRPVLLGDTITVEYTVMTVDKEAGNSRAKVEVYNQHREVVAASEHIMRWTKKLQNAGEGATTDG